MPAFWIAMQLGSPIFSKENRREIVSDDVGGLVTNKLQIFSKENRRARRWVLDHAGQGVQHDGYSLKRIEGHLSTALHPCAQGV